jgi:hypothetical protein
MCSLYGQFDCELVERSSGTRSSTAAGGQAFGLPGCTWGESSDSKGGSLELGGRVGENPLGWPYKRALSAASSLSSPASSPPSLLAFFSPPTITAQSPCSSAHGRGWEEFSPAEP